MPFEKQPLTEGCEGIGLRTLLLALFLLSVAILFAVIGASLCGEESGMIADVMENEAVHAFLWIDTGV